MHCDMERSDPRPAMDRDSGANGIYRWMGLGRIWILADERHRTGAGMYANV